MLDEIQTNALRCNALMRQNEALLAQFVYDRDPASLTETDIQGLSAFAGRLFNYANSEDVGVVLVLSWGRMWSHGPVAVARSLDSRFAMRCRIGECCVPSPLY